jgi:filamentous hemagglutinin
MAYFPGPIPDARLDIGSASTGVNLGLNMLSSILNGPSVFVNNLLNTLVVQPLQPILRPIEDHQGEIISVESGLGPFSGLAMAPTMALGRLNAIIRSGEEINAGLRAVDEGVDVARSLPNQGASNLLRTQQAELDMSTHYCTDCALGLQQAANGEGNVVIFSGKNASWPEQYDWGMGSSNFKVPTMDGSADFAYHSVYTDGRYFYDPLLSAEPIPQSQFLGSLKNLNPDGISWRTYVPEVPNFNAPQLKKGGF